MKLVIFVGGSGTRLWPMSRSDTPKQFLSLVGDKSLFRQSIDRLLTGFDLKDIMVLTGEKYLAQIKKDAPELPDENIILEPEARDTAAAVGYAAAYLDKKFPGGSMGILWADHLIRDTELFIRCLKAAEKIVATENKVVEIDVRPTFADTNLGYIEIGEEIGKKEGLEVFQFIRQVEKPDHATARKFFESFNYLWHTGYAVWSTQKMLEAFKEYSPEIYAHLATIQAAVGTEQEKNVLAEVFPLIPKISVDYAVYEKLPSHDIYVIPADIGWSDVGAWNVLKTELSEDTEVVSIGEHVDHDSTDILVFNKNSKKMIATIGLEGLIIVDTPDALLIVPKERSQDVKKIVEKLKEADKKEYL